VAGGDGLLRSNAVRLLAVLLLDDIRDENRHAIQPFRNQKKQ
jgi:hypothetical protein